MLSLKGEQNVQANQTYDAIIIGGGVSKKSDKWFKYLKANARLVPAKMHNDAGIVGAALAWEHVGR